MTSRSNNRLRRWAGFAGMLVALGCGANVSSPAQDADTALSGAGIRGDYFSDVSLSKHVGSRTDARLDFDWGTGSPLAGVPTDNFSVRWTGFLTAPKTGTYTFTTTSDDGVQLWMNGQKLVDNWTRHGATNDHATIALTAGQAYPFTLNYFEQTGTAVLKLSWTPPGGTSAIVPASAFSQRNTPSGPRFAGDPGVGKFYLGSNDPSAHSGMPQADFESDVLAPHRASVVRIYNADEGGGSFGFNQNATRAAVMAGKIPLTSFIEGPYTLAQIANGAADSALAANIAFLRSLAPHPVWVSYHHEPENDFTTPAEQATYRAAARRIYLAIRAAHLANVSVVGTIYMSGTARNPNLDWRAWNPDWDGQHWLAPSYDLEGLDLYDPPIGAAIRKQYSALIGPFFENILKDRPGDVRPLVIAELGSKSMVSLPDPDFLPASGRPHVNTLQEFYRDLESSIDGATDGVATPIVSVCFFLEGSADSARPPYQNDRLPPATVAEVNALNPGGWPNSSFWKVDDLSGLKRAAVRNVLLASPKLSELP